MEDFQISKLLVNGLGGAERYHRLDLWNESSPSLFCRDLEGQVAIKGKVSCKILKFLNFNTFSYLCNVIIIQYRLFKKLFLYILSLNVT